MRVCDEENFTARLLVMDDVSVLILFKVIIYELVLEEAASSS